MMQVELEWTPFAGVSSVTRTDGDKGAAMVAAASFTCLCCAEKGVVVAAAGIDGVGVSVELPVDAAIDFARRILAIAAELRDQTERELVQ